MLSSDLDNLLFSLYSSRVKLTINNCLQNCTCVLQTWMFCISYGCSAESCEVKEDRETPYVGLSSVSGSLMGIRGFLDFGFGGGCGGLT